MKNKLFLILTMSIAGVLASCNINTSSSIESSVSESSQSSIELPNKISQNDWAGSKKFVNLSTGIKMAYVEMGNPTGPNVILQHGMTDNSRSWSMAAPFFAEKGYHVYLPDLRGMGKSDCPDGFYTPVTYATDLKAFCDAMGIKKTIAVGHSLGSFTVQTFSIMFPELVEKLVLVSSIPLNGYQNDRLIAAYNAYIAPLGEDEHPSDAFMNVWYDTTLAEDEFTDEFNVFLPFMKQEAQVLSKKAWRNIFFGLTAENLMSSYSLINKDIPVLVLHGDNDSMTETQYQVELCEIFDVDSSSYRNYLGIGHNIQFEMPRKCSTDILYWLENLSLPVED